MCKKKEEEKETNEPKMEINKGLLIFCLVLLIIIIVLAIIIPKIK